jgi:hypothetical protein
MSAKHRIAGRNVDLHAFENAGIRPAHAFDPRVHVVLNCGSLGCPRLEGELFAPGDDARIAEMAGAWVDAAGAARIVGTVDGRCVRQF